MDDNVKWEDVIGLEEIKETLQREVIEPLNPPAGTSQGQPLKWRMILLYGVAGSGKTYLMRRLATQVPHSQYMVTPELIANSTTPSETLKEFFEKAVADQPSVLFLDDIELIYRLRPLEYATGINVILHSELDGIASRGDRVVVVASSNQPWHIDAHVCARFDRLLYLPLPHQAARIAIMRHHLQNTSTAFPDHMLDTLGPPTGGFTAADMFGFIHEVLTHSVRKFIDATHYKKVSGPDPDNPTVTVDDLLTPCPPGDVGALEMTVEDIPDNKMLAPPVTMDDMKISLSRSRPSVNEAELIQLQTFTVPLPLTPR